MSQPNAPRYKQAVPDPPPSSAQPVAGSAIQYIDGKPYVMQTATKGPAVFPHYRARLSVILGSVIVSCAILGLILNIIGIIITLLAERHVYFSCFYIGHAIWGAVFFIITGAFAVLAGKRRTSALIITNMVTCLVAIVISGGAQMIGTSTGLFSTSYDVSRQNPDKPNRYNFAAHLFLYVSMMLLLIAQIIAAIASSALSCAVICCGKQSTQEVATALVPLTDAQTEPGCPAYTDDRPPPYNQDAEPETTKAPLPADNH